GGVVGGAGTGLPVVDDPPYQPVERLDRRADVVATDPERPREPCDVVHVEVGDGSGDDGPVLVVHRVVQQREIEVTHPATRARAGSADRRRRAAPGGGGPADARTWRAAPPTDASGRSPRGRRSAALRAPRDRRRSPAASTGDTQAGRC